MKNLTYYVLRIVQEINFRISALASFGEKTKNGFSITSDLLIRMQKSQERCLDLGIKTNNKYPAGRKIVFSTSADEIIIDGLYKKQAILPHMTVYGISGIDIYVKKNGIYEWVKCVAPNTCIQMHLHAKIAIGKGDSKHIVMFLPPYAQLTKLRVWCDEQYSLKEVEDTPKFKIVFYGSSITQGCAASRPGLSFCNIISRRLNVDCVNYGFSESARGQSFVIDAMIKEKPCCYVIEYDHNATIKELKNSHIVLYKTIRASDKSTPIIFMSRFSGGISISREEERKRISIIQNTITYAKDSDDLKTYFISGDNVLNAKCDCFTDDRHPNDYGMHQIADLICKIICREVL